MQQGNPDDIRVSYSLTEVLRDLNTKLDRLDTRLDQLETSHQVHKVTGNGEAEPSRNLLSKITMERAMLWVMILGNSVLNGQQVISTAAIPLTGSTPIP